MKMCKRVEEGGKFKITIEMEIGIVGQYGMNICSSHIDKCLVRVCDIAKETFLEAKDLHG